MTKHEADVIGGLNMTDQISNEVYKQIMIAAQDENEVGDVFDKIKDYINHIRNTGLGKKKSLEFIEKYIDGLKSENDDKITKAELMLYVGKKVHIYFKDEDERIGILKYVDKLPERFGYHKPNYFYIGNMGFKASTVKKVIESES